MGGSKRRYIDTPPRGIMERVIPSVKQKDKRPTSHCSIPCCLSSWGRSCLVPFSGVDVSTLPSGLIQVDFWLQDLRLCCLKPRLPTHVPPGQGMADVSEPIPKSFSANDSPSASTSSTPLPVRASRWTHDPSASSATPF